MTFIHYEKWRCLRGQDPRYIWRSRIKHDCSRVMEFKRLGVAIKIGFGEFVQCEENYIYPLLKSSDVGNGRVTSYRKVVLITQKAVGEDTLQIKDLAPMTWEYLIEYKEYLDKRKSAIYRNRPVFSIFGIGDYSFKQWKIAVSGFYKKLKFNLVGPLGGKTVGFDDTVNFLSFDTEEEAKFVYRLITSDPALEFLESMILWDEKCPITTEILRRLSLKELTRELGELVQYQDWDKTQTVRSTDQMELGISEQKSKYKANATVNKAFHLAENSLRISAVYLRVLYVGLRRTQPQRQTQPQRVCLTRPTRLINTNKEEMVHERHEKEKCSFFRVFSWTRKI